MKNFNTSGPNIPEEHYTIVRTDLINKGINLVEMNRYFTIWAPRQTGKSTYFQQLATQLNQKGYKVAHINFENYKNATLESFIFSLTRHLKEEWNIDFNKSTDLSYIFELIQINNSQKCVLIIDEVEGINADYFGDFLHSIRNAYHCRQNHCLKSVILVGVSNILGVVSDNASPFNISDNLNVPYFTDDEVLELLAQHETETGQLFELKVKQKISDITANQPGLVNGFAYKLVEDANNKQLITYNDYLKTEDWYLRHAIDKNFANIHNKALKYRSFVEHLLFTDAKIVFDIDRPAIKHLHINGIIKDDGEGYVTFWVPFYKKRLYKAFYPYTNGEKNNINLQYLPSDFYGENKEFDIKYFINNYKTYVKRRGFKPFMRKDAKGNYKSIPESSLIYSFETFITAILQELNGKIYREANTGLGKSDMIINIENQEFLIETKVYSGGRQFKEGKKQLAYYAHSLQLKKAVYLVFLNNEARIPADVKEDNEILNNIEITTYIVEYDKNKW